MNFDITFSFWDWSAIVAFFAIVIGIALWCSRRAGSDAKDFFLSGRSMPWWLIGISMSAATTSTNSANMFTQFIREDGLAANWKWWAFLLTGLMTVFVYARLWVRSGAKTDVEFYELRYGGKAAAFLRGFRSVYLGVIFNTISTGLVLLGAIKIGQTMLGLDPWVILLVTAVASIVYSAIGGLRGAVYTDFFLFTIVMIGAFVALYYALALPEVGGFAKMMSNPAVQAKLDFFPSLDNTDLFVSVFAIPVAVQWWNVWYPGSEPGGGGYIVQRMLSAKSENHCVAGSVLYNVVNYALRPWPWYLVAFASLIVFPDLASLQKAFPNVDPSLVKGDMAYPAMLTFVPRNGWYGVTVAAMMGALFSTVAAHLNMGASYVANDFWKRFMRPQASEKELILVGRISVVVLMLASSLLAPCLQSAGKAFNLVLQVGAGTGLIFLLRWFWMRINAWSEITAMAVSFVVALFLNLVYPLFGGPAFKSWHVLLIGMAVTTVAWVGVTLATRPTDAGVIQKFRQTVRVSGHDVGWGLVAMSLASLGVYALMFAVGSCIYGEWVRGLILTLTAVLSGVFLVLALKRL
ncbi:MAG: sodium:solute symporter family protein [bacterium]|nr:sodium:solute symporter family protein [bacterium]